MGGKGIVTLPLLWNFKIEETVLSEVHGLYSHHLVQGLQGKEYKDKQQSDTYFASSSSKWLMDHHSPIGHAEPFAFGTRSKKKCSHWCSKPQANSWNISLAQLHCIVYTQSFVHNKWRKKESEINQGTWDPVIAKIKIN